MAFNFKDLPLTGFDLKKILGDVKLPSLDLETVLASSKKNIEALTAANRAAIEGYQAVAQRQAEILRSTLSEAAGLAQPSKAPEVVAKAMELALSNMRELAELSVKANTEAFEIIKGRVNEGIAELKGSVAKDKA